MAGPFHSTSADALWLSGPRPRVPRLPWEAPPPWWDVRLSHYEWAAAHGMEPGAAATTAPQPRQEPLVETPQPARLDRRLAAVRRWLAVVSALGSQTVLGPQVRAITDGDEAEDDALERLIGDTFATKATSTLMRRGTSMLQLVRWMRTSGRVGVRIDEGVVYAYLSSLRSDGAPASRAQSLLEALRFSQVVVGLTLDADVFSPRVRGRAASDLALMRAPVQARPLEVEAVKALERLAASAPTTWARYKAGFLCFLIHGRARAAEGARALGPVRRDFARRKDGSLLDGFLEVAVARSKTATGKRRRLMLPLVAPARGVLPEDDGRPWGEAWAEARLELCGGSDDSRCLMARVGPPRRDARPMDAPGVSELLRVTLAEAGFAKDGTGRLTSHSCKATTLSWAAKAGLPMGFRRILGGHSKPGETAPRAYGRDELSAPLRALARMFKDIRSGVFLPDCTRSGMVWSDKGEPIDKTDDEDAPDDAHGDEVPLSEASSDDVDADENPDEVDDMDVEVHAETIDDLSGADFVATGAALCKHVPDGDRLSCGRPLTMAYHVCKDDLPVCKRCTLALVRAPSPAAVEGENTVKRLRGKIAIGPGEQSAASSSSCPPPSR